MQWLLCILIVLCICWLWFGLATCLSGARQGVETIAAYSEKFASSLGAPVQSAYARQPVDTRTGCQSPSMVWGLGRGYQEHFGGLSATLRSLASEAETFGVCQDCDVTIPDREIPAGGFSTVNPFIYPYSGAECLDEIQSIVSTHVPLTHATSPDHVVLTN